LKAGKWLGTAPIYFSASGTSNVNFSQEKIISQFFSGLPLRSWIECHETKEITSELFLK